MTYKRAFFIRFQSMRIYFVLARTLFLRGEAHEGVRFLMRQSLCNPEAVI
jgi:hypothetical protein